jgi:hypothetical protein
LRVPVGKRELTVLSFEGAGVVESDCDDPVVTLALKGKLQASAGRKSGEKTMAGGLQRAPEGMPSVPAIAAARTITRVTSIAPFGRSDDVGELRNIVGRRFFASIYFLSVPLVFSALTISPNSLSACASSALTSF